MRVTGVRSSGANLNVLGKCLPAIGAKSAPDLGIGIGNAVGITRPPGAKVVTRVIPNDGDIPTCGVERDLWEELTILGVVVVHPYARAPSRADIVRYSDDVGATWSPGVRVNDDDTKNSQFLPKISLDPTSGNIAVIWYDARNDLGTGGAGDTDGIPNTDAQVWGAFSTDGGQTFTKNIQISAGTSNSHDAQNGIDYGDYSGLSFYRGFAHPAWACNYNRTRDTPDGTLHQLDIYTASVPVR